MGNKRWHIISAAPTSKSASRQTQLAADAAKQVQKSRESAEVRAGQLGAMRMRDEREGSVVIFTDAKGRETGRIGRGVSNLAKSADEPERASYENIVKAAPTEPFKPAHRRSRGSGVSRLDLGDTRR